MPTDNSSCSLLTAHCLPGKAPGRAGEGHPQLQAPQHQGSKGSRCWHRWGFNSFQRGLQGAKGGGEETKKETFRQKPSGRCVGIASVMVFAWPQRSQYWLQAVRFFPFKLPHHHKAQQWVGHHREESCGRSCESEPCAGWSAQSSQRSCGHTSDLGPGAGPAAPRTARPQRSLDARHSPSCAGRFPPALPAGGHACRFLRGGCHPCHTRPRGHLSPSEGP